MHAMWDYEVARALNQMVITSSLSNPLVCLKTWYLESYGGVPWQWLNEVIPKEENSSFII